METSINDLARPIRTSFLSSLELLLLERVVVRQDAGVPSG